MKNYTNMREIRIYQPIDFKEGEVIELNEDAQKHLTTVLRLNEGAKITLFHNNYECKGQIIENKKRKVLVKLFQPKHVNKESFRNIHLAPAIPKGDRMEFIIQKAVELGVTSITPLETARSQIKLDEQRKIKKLQSWQKIVISASEQCQRNTLLHINAPVKYTDFIKQEHLGYKFILSLTATASWRDIDFNNNDDITLIIGPEGGFSNEELAQNLEFIPLLFGPRVLRAETAAISAVSVLQAIAGDLN